MDSEDEEDSYPEDEKWTDALEPGPDDVPAQVNDGSSVPGQAGTSGSHQGGQAKGHVSRMELNTNKAGMDGLDKEKINKIIMEASLGSRYYENEQKKDQQVNERIKKILAAKSKLMNNEVAAAQVKVDKMVKELERTRDLSRTIVHIDMDMFYAAVEMLEKPELREKPMAVGGTHMLSTSNYVARRFGVRAGMPGFIALKLCPNLVMVRPNFDKYRKYSKQVREILEEYDPNFCPMSLDEAYLDFTDHVVKRNTMSEKERTYMESVMNQPEGSVEKNEKKEEEGSEKSGDVTALLSTETAHSSESHDVDLQGGKLLGSISEAGERGGQEDGVSGGKTHLFGISAEEAVREMRFRIQQKTNLTASAGIAPNCMLAKIASDMNKPNGQYVIKSTREEVMKFISNLPVRKVSGIGKVMEKILSAVGVKSCTELYENRAMLYKLFAPISFNHFLKISLGLGSTYVGRDGERKSVSTERTFGGKSRPEDLFRICEELCESLAQDVEKNGLKGRTLTLKLKTVTFEVRNRSQSFQNGICSFKDMHAAARDLLQTEIRACRPHPLALRLMGVRLSSLLSEEEIQQQQKQGSLISFFKKTQLKSTKSPPKTDNETNKTTVEDESCQKMESEMNKDNHFEQKSESLSSSNSPPKDSCKEENTNPLSREQTDEGSVEEDPSEGFTCESEAEVPRPSDNVDETEAESLSENQRYLCPVCNVEKPYNSLEEFNQHVDICLNKGEISTILHKQAKGGQTSNVSQARSSAPMKRPSSSSSRSNKRMKTGRKRQYSTLDKFFAKNS